MKTSKLLILLLVSIFILNSCKEKVQEIKIKEIPSLKSAYKENFYIGVALNTNQILEKDSVQTKLITSEFNSATAENMMKSMHIHPEKDKYNFEIPDKLVAFGKKNNIHIHGHTLVWHSQLSPFFNEIKDSTEMVAAITDHINTIVGRYKGKIKSWDVLNEAFNDDGSLRKTVFLDVLGEDYIALAFKLASEADPEAKLYYNDYGMTNSGRRSGVIKMVKKLQEQDVKIDGIGMQGHFDLNGPSLEQIETSIVEYAALGLKVSITELDITVIPAPWNIGADVNVKLESSDPTMNPYPENLPDSIKIQLAKRYEDIFKIFLKHQDKISRVTFWGVNDGDSWKNDWPIEGRTNYPLLFNRDNQPKKAYDSVIALKEEKKEIN